MLRARALAVVGVFACAIGACESDMLVRQPPEPDGGVADAERPDTSIPDAGAHDAIVQDAKPRPDTGPVNVAREVIYIHTGEALYSYDPARNRAAEIGLFRGNNGPIETMVDIAIDLDGRIFGGTLDEEIYLIDAATAFCHPMFRFSDTLHGLTFLADGRLVVAGERVSILDPIRGELLDELVADDRQYATSGDIVGLPDGKLYWTVKNEEGDGDAVVRIDPRSKRTEMLGDARVTRIFGLGFANDKLYGFSANGVVVTIDPRSGSVLEERDLEGRWWGATTNPVRWD